MGSGLADCWVSGNSSCNIKEGENSFVRAQNNIPFAAEAHGLPVSREGVRENSKFHLCVTTINQTGKRSNCLLTQDSIELDFLGPVIRISDVKNIHQCTVKKKMSPRTLALLKTLTSDLSYGFKADI